MRAFLFLFFATIIVGCDPYYSLSFSAKNDTDKPVFIKFKGEPDSTIQIAPSMEYLFNIQHGIGFAKEKYRKGTYQDWFHDNSMIVTIVSENAVKKVKKGKWKYHGGYINGKATYHIRN
ncbi:MAG: hypothetical protein IT234_07340 [Bacteroidia bacterium]|nr:hypothetical protein [Bacteroidia bacterium]